MNSPTPVSSLLDAALSYAARGWHVFPCHTPTKDGCSCRRIGCTAIGKHPRIEDWPKEATTDAAKIRRWWKQFPTANIAIATGAGSGLVVLDVDPRKGGDATLRDLERSYAPLPDTVEQITGGGGPHHFFTYPGHHVKSGVDVFGKGLDLKADGGYVIAPPSLHVSGQRYTWEILHEPDDTALAPLPPWLLALCQETRSGKTGSAGEPIPQGQRNDTLFRKGCNLRRQSFTEAVILAALQEMNATQCQPPLGEDEVAKIAAQCAKYDAGQAREDLYQRRNGDEAPVASADPNLPLSDSTNALALVRNHGADLHYCHPWKSWLVWTVTHWERDTSGAIMRLAKQTIKAMLRQVDPDDEDAKVKALMAHIKSSLNTARLKAMVENAQSERPLPVQPEDLDTDPWLLNCQNGTLDLHTGRLRPHDRNDLLTKCLPIDYDADAVCPTWMQFLWRIMGGTITPDTPEMCAGELENRRLADENAKALISFLQRALGYSLTGSTREQCMFILHGPTKTGKSTFLATIRALLGPYGKQADMESFMHKDRPEIRNDLADLAGSRLVCALESPKGRRLAENLVKQITGGVDILKARFLFHEGFEFKPEFKVFLATNHKPVIKDTDNAIWERIRLVPFTVHIPKPERNKALDEQLKRELPGILAWAVRGCLEWQHLGELREPEAVVEATAGYRSAMDTLGAFLTECCVRQDDTTVRATTLAHAYQVWCQRSNEAPLSNSDFITSMEERGYVRKRGHANQYYWLDLRLATTGDEHSA